MDISIISQLLHDSQLIDLTWDSRTCCLRMTCTCLRKDIDGSELPDTAVDLIFRDVTAIAIFWGPASHEVRPSRCPSFAKATIEGVRERFMGAGEFGLTVSSPPDLCELETGCGVKWVAGDFDAVKAGEYRFAVEAWGDLMSSGPDDLQVNLAIFCDQIDTEAGSVPLTLEQWHEQFGAWWRASEEHWDEGDDALADEDEAPEEDEDHEDDPVLEDALIPAGESEVDLAYCPPDRPGFDVTDPEIPAELIAPIRNFHQGHLARDWHRMAIAYPDRRVSPEDRATALEGQYLDYLWGRWQYIRAVDDWWQEGQRACVTVRGIEHCAPMDDDPAENAETVITYGLRQSEGRWVIRTWSQGWPRYDSAPEAIQPTPWKDEWVLD
ncbi:MAG: hypothetical protein HQ518_21860 [Rhodopirellula sp.]|nr:hypothetical protein [Rhodopirellula sp.]